MLNKNLFNYINDLLDTCLRDLYNLSNIRYNVEYPQNSDFGDFATNVALIVKKDLQKNPMLIAQEICDYLNSNVDKSIFHEINCIKPGFINFILSNNYLKEFIINDITKYPYINKSKNILIEFSQPNPNKPQHIGHARNNFIGSSMANILSYLNNNVIKANYYNDWGSPVCKTMLMYELYKDEIKDIESKKPDHFIGDLYIMYSKKEDQDKELSLKVQEMFKKLESGDEYTTKLWNEVLDLVYKGWEKTYSDQNIIFDVIFKQSDYKDSGKEVVNMAVKNGIAEKDTSGAIIANLEKYDLPNKVLLRSDGTSLYITQDLQMAMDSVNKYDLDQKIYVVDTRQSDYFKQLFKVLEAIGFKDYHKLYHLAYGFVSLPQGQMSSRSGLVVNADDAFAQVKKIEEQEVKNSIKNIKDIDDTISKVSMCAFKYGMLKIDPKKDIVFDYNTITKFEGNTGPYLMYTYARISSILNKSNINDFLTKDINLDEINLQKKESEILRHLSKFNYIVLSAGNNYSPNILANYLYELCQIFNSYYATTRILDSIDKNKENIYKLFLLNNTSLVLKKGLELLGIEVVKKM